MLELFDSFMCAGEPPSSASDVDSLNNHGVMDKDPFIKVFGYLPSLVNHVDC